MTNARSQLQRQFLTVANGQCHREELRVRLDGSEVVGQLAFLLNCRFLSRSSLTVDVFRGNPVIWWSALALIGLQLVYTYVPFMNDLFGSQPLAIWSWGLPFVLSIAIFLAVELLKLVRRRGDDAARAARFKGGS